MKEEPITVHRERSILTPFLIGGLVGACAALLLAPKSGKELREDIKDLSDTAGEKIVSAIDKGRDLFEGNRSSMKRAVEAAKAAYFEEREKLRQAA